MKNVNDLRGAVAGTDRFGRSMCAIDRARVAMPVGFVGCADCGGPIVRIELRGGTTMRASTSSCC